MILLLGAVIAVILFFPGLGFSSDSIFLILIVFMFGHHMLMMGGHDHGSGHNHHSNHVDPNKEMEPVIDSE